MCLRSLARAGRVRFACLLVPLCGLFGLILLAIAVGFLLPAEYTGSHAVTVSRTPAEVWAAVIDFRRYPIAGGNTRAVAALPGAEGLPQWREDLGRDVSLAVRTTRRSEPAHLELAISGMNTPLEAQFTLELIPVDGGTKISAMQRVEVRGSSMTVPFARLVHFFGGAEQWARDYLSFLERGLGG